MIKKCPSCKRNKKIERFSPRTRICKSCNRKYTQEQSKTAYGGLYVSCKGALRRTKATTGAYKHVTCEFSTPARFRRAVWADNEKRATWERMWQAFMDSGFDENLRPTIDRINPEGSYTMDNIQFLKWGNHRIKDEKVHMLDFFYVNEEGQQCVKRMSKQQAKLEFPELEDIMQGGFGNGLLLQNASITVNPARLINRDREKEKQQAIMHLASLLKSDK